jgi:putative endopeptidase
MRDKAAEEVMKLKNILAREDQEGDNYKDPGKRKSKVDLGTLQKKSLSEESQLSWGEYLTKGASFRNHTFDWNRYFEMIGMQTDSVGMLNVPNFNFLKCFKQVQNSPYFIDYLIFTCTESFANDLPEDFAKVLSPLPTQEAPRWKRAIRIIEEYFDHTIAKLYVENFYTPESWNFLLDSIRSITSSLKAEMKKRLNAVAWLAPDTKIDAIEKVDALQEKIGIPDTWDEYLGVNLSPNNLHMENVLIGRCYCFQRQISRMNKPTNKKEWLCSPMMVNAFYHPSLNEIIFPVAFLQKPMYDPHLDKAVQYGTLGAMIGHEISHWSVNPHRN